MSTQTTPARASSFPRLSPSVSRAHDPVFNHAAALARVDGDEQFLCELAEMFVPEASEHLAAMETALAAEALAEMGRLAHTLKGAACHFVASPTVVAAQALETASAHEDLALASRAYRELRCEVERLLGQLRTLLCSPVDAEEVSAI
jgi:HPt (histidine-containing phosphotransfer) domain-containing protein